MGPRMSDLATASPPAPWQLIRVWHVETLSTVAGHPDAPRFLRTSYGIVPSCWRRFNGDEVRARVFYALELAYRSRNHQSAKSGDPAEMLWVAVGYEMVDAIEMAPLIDPYDDDDDFERVSVRIDRDIHPDVIDAAAALVMEAWSKPRPGIDAKPWTETFTAFRYEEDGDTCHLVKFRERLPTFEAAFVK